MAGQYAKDTNVSVLESQRELEHILVRYGATAFMRGWDKNSALLAFELRNRHIKMVVPMPNKSEFTRTETGIRRTAQMIDAAYDKACRQRWRAMVLVVKAKLEAVESGISTIEQEFMANVCLPSGQTVGEWMQPQIEKAYLTGAMPPLLASGKASE